MVGDASARRAYRYLLPALLLEAGFVFVPLGMAVWYSLHRVRYFEIEGAVGFANYLDILTHGAFLNSLAVTATFSVLALALTFTVGFGLALFLQKDGTAGVVLRTVVLIPYVIAMLVGSLLLKWLFSADAGLIALANAYFGLSIRTILADPAYAMAALVANAIWRDSAFAMIMLLAGLKSIPPTLIAAARIDGAGRWMIFTRIVLPLLKPAMLITLVRLLLHFANVLTFPLILTGGGPNNATDTVALRIFRVGFEDYDLGRANAMAIVLCLFNIAVVVLLLIAFRSRDARRRP
ncbi:MAG: carbohydrate ABC transporter permease [Lautropia sp.]